MPWPAAAGGHAVQDRVGAACVGNKLWEAGTGRAGGMGRALVLKAAQRPRQLPPPQEPARISSCLSAACRRKGRCWPLTPAWIA